jgi:hypothetical protein
MYEFLTDLLNDLFTLFFDTLKIIVSKIIEFIWSLFFDETNGIVWWIIDTFFSLGEWFLVQMVNVLGVDKLLSEYSGVITETMLLCSKLDRFVPIYESVELLFVFLSFLAVFLSVKLILKLIPGIG